MSRVLVLCDEGNNRSVTLGVQLKYIGHDVLTAGLKRNPTGTLHLLYAWADHIITTDESQHVPQFFEDKVHCWHIGPDVYPRPFNRDLLEISKRLVKQHRDELA